MRQLIRASPAALVVLLLALAALGCGDDSDSGSEPAAGGQTAASTSGGGQAAADAFISCFKQPSYIAVHPKPGGESLFALSAKKHGYDVVPVNVAKGQNDPYGEAYLVFFTSESEANKAYDELANASGQTAPLKKGPAIVGYIDDSSKRLLEPAISSCL